jgi:hypothetical protein
MVKAIQFILLSAASVPILYAIIQYGVDIPYWDQWEFMPFFQFYKEDTLTLTHEIIVRLLFSIQIKDVDCDYRLIRRRIMEGVHFTSNSGVICTEMVYTWQQKGVRFAEIPVHHYSREHGNSQFFTWKHLLNALFGLFVLWFTLHFPLRR